MISTSSVVSFESLAPEAVTEQADCGDSAIEMLRADRQVKFAMLANLLADEGINGLAAVHPDSNPRIAERR